MMGKHNFLTRVHAYWAMILFVCAITILNSCNKDDLSSGLIGKWDWIETREDSQLITPTLAGYIQSITIEQMSLTTFQNGIVIKVEDIEIEKLEENYIIRFISKIGDDYQVKFISDNLITITNYCEDNCACTNCPVMKYKRVVNTVGGY